MDDAAAADDAGSSPDAADDSPDGATPEEALAAAEGAGSSPDDADEQSADDAKSEGDGKSDDEDDAEASGDKDSPEYQRLLAKHKGDKGAMARDVWETKRSARVLKEEVDELRAQLAQREENRQSRRDDPADDDVADTPVPTEIAEDLKFVADEITNLGDEKKGYQSQQDEIFKDLEQRRNLINRLEGRIEAAIEGEDNTKAASLRAELDSKKSEYNRQIRAWKDLTPAILRTDREIALKNREKTRLERQVESGKVRARDAQQAQLAEDRNVRATFGEMADEAADEFGYDNDANGKPTTARAQFVGKLKAAVIIRLRSLQGSAARGQKINLARVISDEIDGFRDVLKVGRGKDFRSYSKDKHAVSARTAPKEAAKRVAPPLPKEVDDPNYWKRRAAKIMP